MATPNYSYEKRQRELAKKRKLEEKKQRKTQRVDTPSDQQSPESAGVDVQRDPPPAPHAG